MPTTNGFSLRNGLLLNYRSRRLGAAAIDWLNAGFPLYSMIYDSIQAGIDDEMLVEQIINDLDRNTVFLQHGQPFIDNQYPVYWFSHLIKVVTPDVLNQLPDSVWMLSPDEISTCSFRGDVDLGAMLHGIYSRVTASNDRTRKTQQRNSKLIPQEVIRLLNVAGWVCQYCQQPIGLDESSLLTLDHLVPIYAGGESSISNTVPACKNCNMFKSRGHNDAGYLNKIGFDTATWQDFATQFTLPERVDDHWCKHRQLFIRQNTLLGD